MITHLLEHLGVPTGIAVVVGVAGLILRIVSGKGGSARGGRRQRPPRQ